MDRKTIADLPNYVELPSLRSWGDDAWRDKASCKGVDTNLFFPVKNEHTDVPGTIAISKSRLICAGCSVRSECLTFAVENNIQHGMFGGVSPRERRGKVLKTFDGRLSFKRLARDLTSVRRREKGNHPLPFIEELALLLKVSIEDVTQMLDDPKDTILFPPKG